MPDWTEKEIKAVLGKARLLECTQYFRVHNNSLWFLDKNNKLKMVARPRLKAWIAHQNLNLNYDDKNRKPIADLRKRYERN